MEKYLAPETAARMAAAAAAFSGALDESQRYIPAARYRAEHPPR